MVLHTNWGFSSLTEFTVSFTFNHKQISDWIFFFSFLFFLFWTAATVLVPRFRRCDSGAVGGMAFTVDGVENDEIKSGLERSGNNKHNNYNNNNNNTGL